MVVKGRRGAVGPVLLRGVLFTLRRKCGKSGCRCVTGEMHESPALAYPCGGRTKTMTLSEQDVAGVSAALERYRVAREELDTAADAGVGVLRARIAGRRRQRGA